MYVLIYICLICTALLFPLIYFFSQYYIEIFIGYLDIFFIMGIVYIIHIIK